MGDSEAEVSTAVPKAVVETVDRTLTDLEDLEAHLLRCLAMANDPDAVAEMPPLHRARFFLALAKSSTTLFTLRLRCSGIHPDEHPVKSEIERLRLFEEKLERYSSWSREPLQPSTTINYQAATRFIEHSLPNLTPEQRHSMREISKREGFKKRSYDKKRKYQATEKSSVRAAAQEFLEKAMRELLGSNTDGVKGPMRSEVLDEDETEMS